MSKEWVCLPSKTSALIDVLILFSLIGIEDLVLADINSPSRAQTGDSSSISSFSYREIMKEGSGAGSNKVRR